LNPGLLVFWSTEPVKLVILDYSTKCFLFFILLCLFSNYFILKRDLNASGLQKRALTAFSTPVRGLSEKSGWHAQFAAPSKILSIKKVNLNSRILQQGVFKMKRLLIVFSVIYIHWPLYCTVKKL
jgi:hypothetical protein